MTQNRVRTGTHRVRVVRVRRTRTGATMLKIDKACIADFHEMLTITPLLTEYLVTEYLLTIFKNKFSQQH